ncbi:hypothetical protein BRD17_01205 [Halobacteriales archaeon SW_7_68_16]|nr:MAG: hypothetical protein BRD17_01205 [Halobacteriales archaeon SW_7_68_16]
MGTKYVYTFSSVGHMFITLVHSIKTLTDYVPPEDVIVFYTPPRDPTHREVVADLGVDLREVGNRTEAFAAFDERPSHYGAKTHLCSVDADRVVFLDCDTLVFDDPATVASGPFEFKARPGSARLGEDWRRLFDRFDEPLVEWMPNAGFLVFDDGLHREIESDWLRYLDVDVEIGATSVDHREQYALALAVAGHDLARMDANEHVFEWRETPPAGGCVYHQGRLFDDSIGSIREALRATAEQVSIKIDKLRHR